LTGNDGDYYLNMTSGDVFKKVSGIWVKIGNIKGPPFVPTGFTGTFEINKWDYYYENGILISRIKK